jgi:hypothetical protein
MRYTASCHESGGAARVTTTAAAEAAVAVDAVAAAAAPVRPGFYCGLLWTLAATAIPSSQH